MGRQPKSTMEIFSTERIGKEEKDAKRNRERKNDYKGRTRGMERSDKR